MNYLDFSMVLPTGSPEPDLSGQPDLKDYMSIQLWDARHLVYTAWADPQDQADFREASTKWLQDVRDHCEKLEKENGIEFCNWTVYGTKAANAPSQLTVGHADQDPREHRSYTAQQVNGFLMKPRSLSTIPGWKESSTIQRQAVIEAMRDFITNPDPDQQTETQET